LSQKQRNEVWNRLVSFRRIRPQSKQEKEKESIIGLNFIREATREEINDLINEKQENKALDLANFLEGKGVLNIEKDADLFEKLTAKR